MAARKNRESFEKLCTENWQFVYNEAFSICYDEETANETAVAFFLFLEKELRTNDKTFNSADWMRENVMKTCGTILRRKVKEEMKIRKDCPIRDEKASESAFIEYTDEKIVRLITDGAVNDEIFRNLTVGEKAVLALTAVRNMDERETAAFLKTSVNNIKTLRDRGILKIAASMRFFGKIG